MTKTKALTTQNIDLDLDAIPDSPLIRDALKDATAATAFFEAHRKEIEDVFESIRLTVSVSRLAAEQIKQIQDSMRSPLEEFQRQMKELTSFAPLIRQIIQDRFKAIEMMRGMIIEIPNIDITQSINVNTQVSFEVERIRKARGYENIYDLDAVAKEENSYDSMSWNFETRVDMRLSRLERFASETNSGVGYLIEDAQHKDEMISDLLQLVKGDGNFPLARIEDIQYDSKVYTLTLNGRNIKFSGDTNQSTILRIILADKESMKKTWDMPDFVTEFASHTDDYDNTVERIYQAVYQLNKKVSQHTGIDNFIIFTRKEITLNPKFSQ